MRSFWLLLILSILFFPVSSWAFNNDITHPELTEQAISYSIIDSHLKEVLGISKGLEDEIGGKTIEKWIEYGAEMEDEPSCRASNHFHNPALTWDEAGLTDTWWVATGRCLFSNYQHNARISALTWGTGYLTNNSGIRDYEIIAKNEWDWDSAREYLHTYLTGKDFEGNVVAADDIIRRQYLVKSMRALGQVLHLLQDMAVPAHVRNDFTQGHLMVIPEHEDFPWLGNRFEGYVKSNNGQEWFNSIERGNIPNPRLTDFWDTDDFVGINPAIASGLLGLSEYTQINFLSEYHMFSDDFPIPRKEHCEPYYDLVDRNYLASTNGHPGEQINHLALVSHFDFYVKKYFPDLNGGVLLPLGFDDYCYEEYASKLIPRAIGYSSDLIDYFFRGNLHVDSLPVIYNNSINAFVLNIKNMTPTEEEISNGTLSLVVRYTPSPVEGGPENSDDTGDDIFVLSNEVPIGVLQYNQEQNLQFGLSEPVPIENLESVKCMLAFKGKLGNEENAIIGQSFLPGELKFIEEWDNGLDGNYPWYHSTAAQNPNNGTTTNDIINGVLYKENLRYIDNDLPRINQSFVYFTDFDNSPYQVVDPSSPDGILITPDTYLQFKIDDLSINEQPPAPEGYTTAYQYFLLEFNAKMNGQLMDNFLALEFSQEGQAVNQDGINELAYWFLNGVIISVNIYDAFQSHGITIPEPFYLQCIELNQKLDNLEDPSTIEHVQNMEVDFISIVESENTEDEQQE